MQHIPNLYSLSSNILRQSYVNLRQSYLYSKRANSFQLQGLSVSRSGAIAYLSTADLIQHFSELPDPRIERTKEHKLIDIVVIAICAIIAGVDGWVAVETFGHAKEKWLHTLLALLDGIPSHDTLGRVFGLIDPTDAVVKCSLCCRMPYRGRVIRGIIEQIVRRKYE